MFTFIKKRKEKAYTKQNIDVFDVHIDREIDYNELTETVKLLEAEFPTEEAKKNDYYPSINEEQNKRLIAAVDRYMYYPGDKISGSVTLTLSSDIPAKELNIVFMGCVIVRYESDDVLKEKVEGLYLNEVPLWSYVGEGSSPVLHVGTYTYNFEFQLPPDMLGTVFYANSNDEGGMISFAVFARITLSSGSHVSSDETFIPVQRLLYKGDPFVRPEVWSRPVEIEEKESFGFLSGGGTIEAKCTLHPGVFTVDGQDILFDLNISNKSRKPIIKIKAWLQQVIRLRYEGTTKYETEKFISEIKIPVNVRPRDDTTLRGIRLPVPIGLEPTLDKHGGSRWASSLAVKYNVQVGVFTGHHLPGPFFNYENVVVGSQPRGGPVPEPYSQFVTPGNYEYKTCDVKVCVKKSFCSARQAIVAAAQDTLKAQRKAAEKAAKKAGK